MNHPPPSRVPPRIAPLRLQSRNVLSCFPPPENAAVLESAGPPISLAQRRFGVQTLPKTAYSGFLFPDELREKREDSLESSLSCCALKELHTNFYRTRLLPGSCCACRGGSRRLWHAQ